MSLRTARRRLIPPDERCDSQLTYPLEGNYEPPVRSIGQLEREELECPIWDEAEYLKYLEGIFD